MIVVNPVEGAAVPRWDIYRDGTCLGSVELTPKKLYRTFATYSGSGTSNAKSLLRAASRILRLAKDKKERERRRWRRLNGGRNDPQI